MIATASPDFCSVAVHIGRELKKRVAASGIPVTTFSKKVGRTPQNIYQIFKSPSTDTLLLRRASEVLNYDFFKLYSEDLGFNRTLSVVGDPQAPYGKPETTVEITIRSTGNQGDLIERIVKSVDPPKDV